MRQKDPLANEDVPAMHLERSVGEFATTSKVSKDRVDPSVASRDVALAWHYPGDVGGEQPA